MRRTLWVLTPPLARTVHAAATRKVAGAERRRNLVFLTQSGIPEPERWLDDATATVLAVLHEHGPMTARRMGTLVPALRQKLVLGAGSPNEATVSAHTRVLLQLGFDGALVRTRPTGTWINGQYTWAAMDDWLPGGVDGRDEQEAARDLADALLRRFGPGTADRPAVVGRLDRRHDEAGARGLRRGRRPARGRDRRLGRRRRRRAGSRTSGRGRRCCRGSTRRRWAGSTGPGTCPRAAADSFDRNGNAGPTIWVDGRVVGYWVQRPDGGIRLHWFEPVPAARRRAVERRAEEVREWLGDSRFSVRFPGKVHPEVMG